MTVKNFEENRQRFLFSDPQYSFQTLRTVGAADGEAADIGECLAAAQGIFNGDDESWYREWLHLAKRIEQKALNDKNEGFNESARTAFLRASNYYRTAEFFLHANPSDPRLIETWRKSRKCFQEAIPFFKQQIKAVRIPFEKTTLPGYLCFSSNDTKPLLIIQTGFDGTAEELYYQIAHAALKRNYHCLLFEGPGQGEVIREQQIPFRYNWETVITAVMDFALTLDLIDKERIGLIGISFGGYLVPRALAFEKRFRVGIANGGVYDFHKVCMRDEMEELDSVLDDPAECKEIDKEVLAMMKSNPSIRWAFGNGMFTFGAKTPSEWLRMTRPYQMKDHIENITTKMLVMDSEIDEDMPGQSKIFFDALRCPKDYMLFKTSEGAGEHCQIGAYAYSNERLFNWLDRNL